MLELKEERKIFGVSSSEVLERLEWNKGNFSNFFRAISSGGVGQPSFNFPCFLLIAGEKPKHQNLLK